MGDWLRRLLYPLVLPVIVGTVWLCGWVRQQDDRAARGMWTAPIPSVPTPAVPPDLADHLPPAHRPRIRTEFFAAAPAEELADEPAE